MDRFGRQIDYLRISVTDRCNERCLYCMPQSYTGWEPRADHLTTDEIVEIAGTAVRMGVRKLRITGGEPLLRRDIIEIVRRLAGLSRETSVAMTTNGLLLEGVADELKAAGLSSLNVSLDALNPERYRSITGGNLAKVLAGIEAARRVGIKLIKLNTVLIRGHSEAELWPLARYAAERGIPLRLIELMPLTTREALSEEQFFPVAEAMRWYGRTDELIPGLAGDFGWGPARYFRLRRTGTVIGFIGALTETHFCESCNKMRLTADGKIRPCLGDAIEVDARSALRSGGGAGALPGIWREALIRKPEKHDFARNYQPCRPMTAIGG